MNYKMTEFGDLLGNEANGARMLNDDPRMETSFFHIKQGACLNITFSGPEDFIRRPTVMYIVINGAIELCENDENCFAAKGQCLRLNPLHNFSVWAREESDVICISNDGGGRLDTDNIELLETVKMAERNDVYVIGHNYRVSRYSMMIMQIIAPERVNETLRLASGFHDVGKVRLDPAILNKPGRLTSEEFDHIKTHPVHSWEILRRHFPEEIANISRWHHEKLDGSGYPDGITGEQIPLESRVIAVADIFDALTTSRCYRSSFSFQKALDILGEDAERGKIDKAAFEALKLLVERGTLREGVDNVLRNSEA